MIWGYDCCFCLQWFWRSWFVILYTIISHVVIILLAWITLEAWKGKIHMSLNLNLVSYSKCQVEQWCFDLALALYCAPPLSLVSRTLQVLTASKIVTWSMEHIQTTSNQLHVSSIFVCQVHGSSSLFKDEILDWKSRSMHPLLAWPTFPENLAYKLGIRAESTVCNFTIVRCSRKSHIRKCLVFRNHL
jgi:hypothetical protein